MGQNRGHLDRGGNDVQKQGPGDQLMDQSRIVTLTTAGDGAITAESILQGVVRRSGPAAGFNDTFPSADALMAANPYLDAGDSFKFVYQNTVAQAMTAVAGTGVVLGTNVNVAASAVRTYLVQILADGRSGTYGAASTNGSAVLQLNRIADAKNIIAGMGISGTGIPANTTVASVNTTTGAITMSANATATAAVVGVTTTPRYQIDGLFAATA